MHVGFDVEGDQPQARAVVRCGFHLCIEQRAAGVRRAAEPCRCVDETLHQVAFRRADIAFVHVDTGAAQRLFQLHQLAMLLAVKA
ncbi:hypothetical protein D9M68_780590 [compost metagenome]